MWFTIGHHNSSNFDTKYTHNRLKNAKNGQKWHKKRTLWCKILILFMWESLPILVQCVPRVAQVVPPACSKLHKLSNITFWVLFVLFLPFLYVLRHNYSCSKHCFGSYIGKILYHNSCKLLALFSFYEY